MPAPPSWAFTKFAGNQPAIRNFLQQNHAKSISVPYQANRAVIFDSALLHKTNKVRFSEGYGNRRINITLLYGERNNDTPD